MELSHHELELSVGESIQIGSNLITAIDTPDHGIALLIETIPDGDAFHEFDEFEFESDAEFTAAARPR